MKTSLITTVLLAAFGCSRQPNEAPPVSPQLTTTCRLVSYESSGTIQGSISGTRRDTYLATYDAGGLLTGSVSVYRTEGAGSAFESRSTASYQYEGAGFLRQSVISTQSTSGFSGNASTSVSTETRRFTYVNERLAMASYRNIGPGSYQSARTETYQYDGDGRLNQYTSTDSASRSVRSYTYAAGKLTRVTQDGKDQYTVQDGRITASTSGLTYTYDARGRLTGTKSSTYSVDYEYAEAGQSGLLTYPEIRFKGIPYEALLQVPGGAELHGLVARETQYQETNGTRKKMSELVATYQLNAQNLPIRQTMTRTIASGTSPYTEQSTSQYTYRDCQ